MKRLHDGVTGLGEILGFEQAERWVLESKSIRVHKELGSRGARKRGM